MSSDLYALSPPYTAILVVNTVLCVLGLVTAALRILSRRVRNAKLRPDDWCIICAVVRTAELMHRPCVKY